MQLLGRCPHRRTTTLKCLPCAAARLSSANTTREFPWVITTLPSRMKHSPSSAILARAFNDVAANVFPRSINQALDERKSDESSAAVRVAYLRQRTHHKAHQTRRAALQGARQAATHE